MKTNAVMSMVNPSTDALMSKVDSRYGLVVLAARRARQLMAGAEAKAENLSTKNVTNALEEIAEGKITYEIAKDFPEEPEEEINEEDLDEFDDEMYRIPEITDWDDDVPEPETEEEEIEEDTVAEETGAEEASPEEPQEEP